MFELSLLCSQVQVETVSDALVALEAQSVSVEDADALTALEQPLFGEPGMVPTRIGWNHSRIQALFADEPSALDAARILATQDFFVDCQLAGIAEVPEQDWVRLTQAQFAPVAITPDFWIVPTWHEPPAQARHIIRLDPGLAFGTGTHPTTSMCLRWIASHTQPLGRVLDYGCGSGILAIGAAMFGATAVDALDLRNFCAARMARYSSPYLASSSSSSRSRVASLGSSLAIAMTRGAPSTTFPARSHGLSSTAKVW